jgi:hypothetical protein
MGLLWKLIAVLAIAFSTEFGRDVFKSLVDRFWKKEVEDLQFDQDHVGVEKELEKDRQDNQ